MFGLEFQFAKVSSFQFWATLIIGFFIILGLIIYLGIFVWYFGSAMRKYLTAKLTPGTGIIQEYYHDIVELKLAKYKDNEFKDIESKNSKPIVAQSLIHLNGTPTIMVWNINPKLPERYITILKTYIKEGYTTLEEVYSDLESKIIEMSTVIGGITVEDFLRLHEKIKTKNELNITPDDILSFSTKYLDEHANKSVVEREVTINIKRSQENKFQTYAFYLIALMIIGAFIIIAWKIKYGGGK